MPSFQDSAFIFILALILFGPKRLPELARQLGKLMGEFRRASNEFRSQMEEELRIADQAEKTKKIAAIETAAPVSSAAVSAPAAQSGAVDAAQVSSNLFPESASAGVSSGEVVEEHPHMPPARRTYVEPPAELQPVPIATSGDLHLMPPATGLPMARSAPLALGADPSSANGNASVASVFESFPQTADPGVLEDAELTIRGHSVPSISGGSDALLADKAAHHV